MTINVKSPGLSTGVQDLGRTGYFHLGIPISGGMDRLALRVANMLVGNEEGAAVLECAFLGPELDFTANALVAVTGAEMPPKVDGETRETWTAFEVQAGQTLSFHYLKAGARAYVAVSGGIDVPVVLGSRSTYLLGGMGGVDGRLVQAGDRLPVGLSARKVDVGRSLPPHLRPELPVEVNLRMLPDIYWHRITEASQQAFLDDTWKVAPEADRIGYRFRGGRRLQFVPREQPFGAGSDPSNIVDGCYPYGSIQVPAGEEPIVLHRDAVSGGGYFMLGTVISADMDRIGQLQPNTKARFVAVDMEAALAARRERRLRLETIREELTD